MNLRPYFAMFCILAFLAVFPACKKKPANSDMETSTSTATPSSTTTRSVTATATATSTAIQAEDPLSKMPLLEEETKDSFSDKMVDFILTVLKPQVAVVRDDLLRDPWDD